MKKKFKYATFLGQSVYVCYCDAGEAEMDNDIVLDFPAFAAGGVFDSQTPQGDTIFVVWFNASYGDIPKSIIAHEVWHLFFKGLSFREKDTEYTAIELSKELYATTFEQMYRLIEEYICEFKEAEKKEKEAEKGENSIHR